MSSTRETTDHDPCRNTRRVGACGGVVGRPGLPVQRHQRVPFHSRRFRYPHRDRWSAPGRPDRRAELRHGWFGRRLGKSSWHRGPAGQALGVGLVLRIRGRGHQPRRRRDDRIGLRGRRGDATDRFHRRIGGHRRPAVAPSFQSAHLLVWAERIRQDLRPWRPARTVAGAHRPTDGDLRPQRRLREDARALPRGADRRTAASWPAGTSGSCVRAPRRMPSSFASRPCRCRPRRRCCAWIR